MQPYVIRQGDYLFALAYQMGFDADAVWNDPSNADLKTLRPDPNLLFPGDILQIPSTPRQRSPGATLVSGTTNTFVSDPPTVTVNLKFVDLELASQPFTVAELPTLTGLATGADGAVAVTVPITQPTVTVVFSSDGTTFTCGIGSINPVNTASGVAHRLQNLGYLDPMVDFGIGDLDAIRDALRAFRADQAGGATPSAPASGEASSTQGPDSSPPPSGSEVEQANQLGSDPPESVPPPPVLDTATDDAAAPTSTPSPSPSSPPPSSNPAPSQPPTSAPSPSEPPPSSGDAASSPDAAPADNAGLDDNGALDEATSQLLLRAHGS